MSSMNTVTKDGTKIKVEGAGPEIPTTVKAPSNKSMDKALSRAQKDLEAQKPKIDSHGRNIIESTQNLLDATQTLLAEKNSEERFQRLFTFTKGTAKGMQPSDGLGQAAKNLMGQASGMGSKISNNATDIFSWIRETMLNLATSSEFRQLSIEFLDLMQAMLGQLKTSMYQAPHDKPLSTRALRRTRAYDSEAELNDEINDKLSILLRHVGQNPQYQKVIENFLNYSEDIYDRLYKAGSDRSSSVKENEDLRQTVDEAWEILHDFAGRDSNLVPKLKKEVQGMLTKLRNDEELTAWAKDFKKLLIDLMERPENSTKNSEHTRKLINKGQVFSNKYRRDLDKIYSYAKRAFQQIQDDPTIKQFQSQLNQLAKDIALNSQGQPDLFVVERSMSIIKDLIVERFRKALVDVPIKRVVINNDQLDLELSNITLEGTGMVPDHLHVELSSLSDFHFSKSANAVQRFRIRLAVDHITPRFSGVEFILEKKSFPSLKDHGIADLYFEGEGLSADVTVEFKIVSNQISKAELTNCTTKIDRVNLKIEEQKHNILGALFTPMIQSNIKSKMQTGVEQFVEGRVYQIINQLNDWFRTKPFESLMQRGTEGLQDAQRKRSEKKVAKELDKANLEKTSSKDKSRDHKSKDHHSKDHHSKDHHSKDHHDKDHHDKDHGELKKEKRSSSRREKETEKQEKLTEVLRDDHKEKVHATLDKEHKGKTSDHHVESDLDAQAFNQSKFTQILNDDDPVNMKHKDLLHEVKKDHDLQHVKTDDKSKPKIPADADVQVPKKKSSKKELKEGEISGAPKKTTSLKEDLLHEVKQDHHLSPVLTDDKSAPKVHDVHHEKTLKEEVKQEHDLRPVLTDDKSAPKIHPVNQLQQHVQQEPSS